MRIHYLIQAHYMPECFHALIDALNVDGKDSRIIAHIDAKTDAAPFRHAVDEANVTFVPDSERVSVNWAGWSQVKATLKMARLAMLDAHADDYLILLSGDTFPLRTQVDIIRALEEARGAQFINGVQMPASHKPMERISRFHFEYDRRNVRRHRFKSALAYRLNSLHIPQDYTRALGGRVPYGGSQWFALTGNAMSWVLDQAANDKRFVRLCRHSHCADEFFFQTLLFNSSFKESIQPTLMYADWSSTRPGPHPAHIDAEHVRDFVRARLQGDASILSTVKTMDDGVPKEYLFARKVTDEAVRLLIREKLWALSTSP